MCAVARDGERQEAEQLGTVRIDGGVRKPPRVVELELPSTLAQVPLDDRQAASERLQGLDCEPALVRPLARRDAMPRAEGGIEIARIVDAEIAEPRPDPRLVDDAIAPMPVGERDVRFERGLDELGVGARPGDPDEDADVTALDEPEPPRPAGDLGDLPRQQVAPLDSRRTSSSPRRAGSRTAG